MRSLFAKYELTSREAEVAELAIAQKPLLDIAREFFITERTVKFHLRNIFRKVGVKSLSYLKEWVRTQELQSKRLIISETSTSMQAYHLRLVGAGEEQYGGGAGPALCGKELGWDTKFDLKTWGMRSHIPCSYCKECEKEAKKLGYKVQR